MSSRFIFDADYPRALLAEYPNRAFPDGISLLQNWHFGDPVCWSRRQTASLAVEQTLFPSPVELIVELEVFNASEESPKILTVESFGHALRRYVFTTSESRQIVLITPQFVENSQSGEIVFHLDKIESPFEIGLANDDRLLGIAIHAIWPLESQDILPLDLTEEDDVDAYLVNGWSVPEAIGIWTHADVADIRLERSVIREMVGVELTFDVMSRPDTALPLTITVSCNDREIETLSLSSGEDIAIRVPFTDAYLLSQDQHIQIELTNLVSPAELGLSTDGRRLGICLKRIEPVYPDVSQEHHNEAMVP